MSESIDVLYESIRKNVDDLFMTWWNTFHDFFLMDGSQGGYTTKTTTD
jgi:hypothetical protein